jgi:hypothetical protein
MASWVFECGRVSSGKMTGTEDKTGQNGDGSILS